MSGVNPDLQNVGIKPDLRCDRAHPAHCKQDLRFNPHGRSLRCAPLTTPSAIVSALLLTDSDPTLPNGRSRRRSSWSAAAWVSSSSWTLTRQTRRSAPASRPMPSLVEVGRREAAVAAEEQKQKADRGNPGEARRAQPRVRPPRDRERCPPARNPRARGIPRAPRLPAGAAAGAPQPRGRRHQDRARRHPRSLEECPQAPRGRLPARRRGGPRRPARGGPRSSARTSCAPSAAPDAREIRAGAAERRAPHPHRLDAAHLEQAQQRPHRHHRPAARARR